MTAEARTVAAVAAAEAAAAAVVVDAGAAVTNRPLCSKEPRKWPDGVGLSYRNELSWLIHQRCQAGSLQFCEVIAENIDPDNLPAPIVQLLERGVTVVPHGVSLSLGIATVFQDLALCENLDVVANIFLGRELDPYALDEVAMEVRAWQLLNELSAKIPSVREVAPNIRVPVLVVQGEEDTAVRVRDVRALAPAFAGNRDYTAKFYPGLGHALAPKPSRFEDFLIPMVAQPKADIAAWIKARSAAAPVALPTTGGNELPMGALVILALALVGAGALLGRKRVLSTNRPE